MAQAEIGLSGVPNLFFSLVTLSETISTCTLTKETFFPSQIVSFEDFRGVQVSSPPKKEKT